MAFIDGNNGENFITERLIEQWNWLEQLPKQAPWINDVFSRIQNDGLHAIKGCDSTANKGGLIMTLLQLLKQIRCIESRLLTTEGIPLKMYNYDIDLELELHGENGDYWVDVKLIPDAKQFQQMLSKRIDYEVKIKKE